MENEIDGQAAASEITKDLRMTTIGGRGVRTWRLLVIAAFLPFFAFFFATALWPLAVVSGLGFVLFGFALVRNVDGIGAYAIDSQDAWRRSAHRFVPFVRPLGERWRRWYLLFLAASWVAFGIAIACLGLLLGLQKT